METHSLAKYFKEQEVIHNRIEEFMMQYDIENTDEARSGIISLLQDLGVEFDACSICGAMPMNTNCNNAECN